MKKGSSKETVFGHLMTGNFWEFYLLENPIGKDIVRCLVMGYENEIGDVSLSEIAPHVISVAKKRDFEALFPPTGWQWCED
jgi:hypothetical protein